MVSQRLRELFPDGFWLYVDNSPQSQEVLEKAEWLQQAKLLVVSNLSEDGGFADGVSLPRLLRNGDVMTGWRLHRFIQFLGELNDEFNQEEIKKGV